MACAGDGTADQPLTDVRPLRDSHAGWTLLAAERQAIHRGTFTSVRDLNAKIRSFVNGWNDGAHPFVWTKTADEILKKANCQTTPNTDHTSCRCF